MLDANLENQVNTSEISRQRFVWNDCHHSTKEFDMINKIFVNLAVKDLDKSTAFFKALGFSFNPQFTDKTAACMIISDDIYSMLLTHEKFAAFTKKPIADAHKSTEVLTALAVESKARVHELVDKADQGPRQRGRRAAGLRFHVRPQFRGPGWAYLGDFLDGSCACAERLSAKAMGRGFFIPKMRTRNS